MTISCSLDFRYFSPKKKNYKKSITKYCGTDLYSYLCTQSVSLSCRERERFFGNPLKLFQYRFISLVNLGVVESGEINLRGGLRIVPQTFAYDRQRNVLAFSYAGP